MGVGPFGREVIGLDVAAEWTRERREMAGKQMLEHERLELR